MPFSPRPVDGVGGLAFALPNGPVVPVILTFLALLIGGARSVEAARTYDPSILPKARYVAPLAAYPAASYRAKDFSVITRGEWYHLFYTRVQRFVPDHWSNGTQTVLNETSLGHAMSPDLETWFELDTVLTVSRVPGAWDEHHVWAPTLVEHDGVTWMLYTAVRDLQQSTNPADWIPRWQVIAAAYSTDPLLQTWVRYFDPVWQPCAGSGLPGVNWALCTPNLAGYSADFRDPYVLAPAPGSADPWLLFYTARVHWDAPNYVAGVATGPGPVGPWSDLGALWDTYYLPQNSKIESPHAFRRGTEMHLLFSGDDGSTGIVWQTATGSPLEPWTTRRRLNDFLKYTPDLPYQFNLEPEAWFASEQWSESTSTGPVDYLAVVHSYNAPPQYNPPLPASGEDISAIEFRRIVWGEDGSSFHLVAPNLARALRISPEAGRPDDLLTLEIDSQGGTGERVDLRVTVIVDGREFPVDPGDVGLPTDVVLTDPTTVVPWTLVGGGLGLPQTIRVSIANQPMRSGATVLLEGGSDEGELPADDVPIVHQTPWREPRLFTRSAGSGGGSVTPELALELPAAGRVGIALHDVTGRLVRTLVDDSLPAGASTWRWDGLDAQGRPAPRGLYFARLTTERGAVTARILLAR